MKQIHAMFVDDTYLIHSTSDPASTISDLEDTVRASMIHRIGPLDSTSLVEN